MQPLKDLNCGIGGDKGQYVLWCAYTFPVVKSVKKLVNICGTKNLNQDALEDITDGIMKVAGIFKI